MIYFTAHTFKCVCHCRRAMFRVLGMYNFGLLVTLLCLLDIKYTKYSYYLHTKRLITVTRNLWVDPKG